MPPSPNPRPVPSPLPLWPTTLGEVPAPAKRRRPVLMPALVVVALILAIGGTAAAVWRYTRSADVPNASMHAPPAATSAPPAAAGTGATPGPSPTLLPQQDRQLQLSQQIGMPDGFTTFHAPAWDGPLMHADYSMLCQSGRCLTDPALMIVAWAGRAGVPPADLAADKLAACVGSTCRWPLSRNGFQVELTARAGPDSAAGGDIRWVAGIAIRQS